MLAKQTLYQPKNGYLWLTLVGNKSCFGK
jgi:hypothetical protein